MKKSKVDRSFLLGVMLFSDQMQLSIDRSTWEDFVVYAKRRISINRVLELIRKKFPHYQSDENKLIKPNVNFFNNLLIMKNHLYDVEQKYIYYSLKTLSDYLQKNEKPNKESIVNLRLNLAYCGEILGKRISDHDKNFPLVEHLNQSETLKTKSIDDLIGSDWLNQK